tara:strand:- start:4081 stop:5370 length:1290 start_codon:yes stop_codon:yes gene_type:complete
VIFLDVRIDDIGDGISFSFEMDEEEQNKDFGRISFGSSVVTVRLDGLDSASIHPDLLALSSILMCHPFVGKELNYPNPVSEKFNEAVNGLISRYEFKPKSGELVRPRSSGSNFRMGLAFSGGVDSTAALSVLPEDSVPVFMLRPSRGKSLYDPSAALESCKLLEEVGYDVRVVECDVEFIREPVGFPTDLSHAIPSILLADDMCIDSLAFGTVMESAFGIGHEKFRDYWKGSHWKFYSELLGAVSIDLCLPVSGVSEVGTAIIVNSTPLGELSQSCIRGKWKKPCKRCWKCCRKGLLSSALELVDLKSEDLELMFSSEDVRNKLSSIPISHENVIEYALQRIDRDLHPNFPFLRGRIERGTDLGFLECWFEPSSDFIPEKYRKEICGKIKNLLRTMDEREEEKVRKWDLLDYYESEETESLAKLVSDNW